jgi:hypothetical protein
MKFSDRVTYLKRLKRVIAKEAERAGFTNVQYPDIRAFHVEQHNEYVEAYNENKFFWQRKLKEI